ncbi:glycosyltransferase involved in cell wall biosynthesis [Bradyrhizobium huanghuaihaiense]|uniref:Glycosyltransferase involved in cell wall biosynthesis n=1 Tax=Bradyrhizobium huanghuaihaiense TaxID=990078 RepID=A0A562RPB1_9BRAD|nr:glycosyltransferase family 2 protein [Bradyrhizobium huanghuaihaiense]TWI70878.1 glycosyltransferase involved in cell wall biosynthesis [Bradyrhizobium huanghuaihaiense]
MISVVIPALNERNGIVDTIARAKAVLDGAQLTPYEIIVVDDGSNDGTGALAEQAGAKVLRHAHNIGYGRSLKDGIRMASFETIVISDADGSYPIESIPALIARLNEGFDMVVGARTGPNYRESMLKSPLRAVLKVIVEFTANREIPDINSGLRAFRRQVAISFFDHVSDLFSFTTSLTLAYMMNAKFVDYIPIDYAERIGRSKVNLFRDSLRTLQYVLEACTYYNPLKIFVLLAMMCMLLAVISLVGGIILQVVSGFVLGVGAILLSILVVAMGLLAVLLKQIMNQRP